MLLVPFLLGQLVFCIAEPAEPHCPALEIANARNRCPESSPYEECKIHCEHEFELDKYGPITCESHGNWSRIPSCIPKPHCPALEIANAANNCHEGFRNDECKIVCEDDFDLDGYGKIRCESHGNWSRIPSCIPRPHCPALEIANTRNSCPESSPYEECKIICEHAYELDKYGPIICESHGNWNRIPSCIPRTYCPALEIAHAINSCPKSSPYEVCEIFCEHKFEENEHGRVITCDSHGNWSRIPSCIPRPYCPALKIANASNSCPKSFPNEECDIFCNDKFELVGHRKIICESHGTWSRAPSCVPIPFCPDLKIENARKHCPETYPYEECKIFCKDNFESDGDEYIICESHGNWNRIPSCIPKTYCPALKIANATHSCPKSSPLEECKIHCEHEFELVGYGKITCESNGDWSRTPSCIPMPHCPALKIANATEGCPEGSPYDQCEILCEDNFEPDGSTKYITCESHGVWSRIPSCIPKPSCPALEIANATDGCPETFLYDDCEFLCEDDFEPDGDDYITCESAGKWSRIPSCIPIEV